MHALLIGVALALAAAPHKTKIAVLDVQDVSGDQAAHARLLTQIITGELSRDGTLEVISSTQIRNMLGFEKQKQILGCTEGSCLAEIGGALGVDYLLTGQIGKIGSRYRLDLSLVEQAKARTAATVGEFLPAEEDALADAAVRMVTQLLDKAGLRKADSPALDAAISSSAPGTSHTGAYVGWGIAAALAVGAGVMTAVTNSTYQSAVTDYSKPGAVVGSSDAGKKLGWMRPLTMALWGGAIVAAGTGTVLFFTAGPSGSGGEIAVGGSF